jgi:hypothetical protein
VGAHSPLYIIQLATLSFNKRHMLRTSGVFRILQRGGLTMASVGARAYMGVWGRCPQRGPGAEPLVRGALPP